MKRALALCGGGSKGSYEMGAWQALKELDIHFDIVCGTSIGALNGVMVAQDRYDECLELWKNTRNDTILKTPVSIDTQPVIQSFKNMSNLLPFIKSYLKEKGADISPFKKTLDKYIDEDKVINSKMDFGVVCVSFPSFKPLLVDLKKVKREEIKQYILASCSCFPLFPMCKIGKDNLIDGGYFDNLPIDFCLDFGAHEIVAIDLNFNITHREYLHKPFIKYIHPSWDLGGFFNFEENLINRNMILGYNDTMKAYNRLIGKRYTFYKADIEYIAKKFIVILANINKDFNKSKIKMLYKDDINVYDILESKVEGNLSYSDYYIRAIEELMEYLDYNPFNIYRIDKIEDELYEKIVHFPLKYKNILNTYNNTKGANKKREYLQKLDDKSILSLGYNLVHDGKLIPKDLVLDLYAINPNLVVYLVLAMVWSDVDAEEEKNFGFTFEFE